MSLKSRGWASAALLTLALSATGTGVAIAATPPTATTGPATAITATSATLNGTVTPNKTATTYYFQYGKTTAYTSKTATATANGNASKAVSATVTGLTAATTYHFRLVATNPNGTSNGKDLTFTTAASGSGGGGNGGNNAVSIKSTPPNIVWGNAAVISGQVTGPKSNNQTVTLESTPYPYTRAFKPTGATTTTSNTGAYSFTVRPGKNTRYEVVAATKTPATSAPVTVGVKVKVVFHTSTLKPARGQLVRFYGTVAPAQTGKYALIQRRTSTGTWKTVATTKLLAGGTVSGTAISKYSRRLRIYRSGTYRVRVNPRAGNLTGNSATHTERVH